MAPGGAFKPKECLARTKLAVIVAFRDRDAHLKVFLHHMHPIFQRQLLEYRIFVVEQTPTEEFNRGALMNIGYTEALKVDNFDCFAFHDVDLVPEDDRSVFTEYFKSSLVFTFFFLTYYINYSSEIFTNVQPMDQSTCLLP